MTGLLNAPVVFAHNDMLCGTLMVNDEEGVYDFCWCRTEEYSISITKFYGLLLQYLCVKFHSTL